MILNLNIHCGHFWFMLKPIISPLFGYPYKNVIPTNGSSLIKWRANFLASDWLNFRYNFLYKNQHLKIVKKWRSKWRSCFQLWWISKKSLFLMVKFLKFDVLCSDWFSCFDVYWITFCRFLKANYSPQPRLLQTWHLFSTKFFGNHEYKDNSV